MRVTPRKTGKHPAWPLALCLLGLLVFPSGGSVASERAGRGYAGLPLADALLDLRAHGLKIVFTSNVVRDDMIVEGEPASTEPREAMDEMLAAHGLAVSDGPRETLVVVRATVPTSGARASNLTVTGDDLTPVLTLEEELVITPSRLSLMRQDPVSTLSFTREEILALPHLSDDFYRALSLFPGVVANDVSAQFHVRGGRRDETQILLDGQELYDAYHLKDFDNALSFVSSGTLASADLTTGGYTAEYGDRMSGVLDMKTLTPSGPARGSVGAGILSAHIGGAGTFSEERGTWLAQARRGTIDLASQLLGNEDPQYWDGYSKITYQFDDKNSVRGNLLYSQDKLQFKEFVDGDSKQIDTRYQSGYGWLTQQTILTNSLFFETAGSVAIIDQDRDGVELEEDVEFTIRDERDTQIRALRQGWTYQGPAGHLFKTGFEIRRFDTTYDYMGVLKWDNPLAGIRTRFAEEEVTDFARDFEENHTSLYLADRITIGDPITLELGLRFDDYTLTDESHLTPRLNLAWAPDPISVVRFAVGRFYQSQRPYELQVEDGEDMFFPVEQSEHWLLGYEREFPNRPEGRRLAFRTEIYYRDVRNPRPRYENLYEPLNTFPEVEPDRVRIAPDRSVSEGLELFLRGQAGPRVVWFVNYTLSSIEDEIGGAWFPRSIDQTHSVRTSLDFEVGKQWHLNLAWRWHTGWPTTPITVEAEIDDAGDMRFVPVLGPLNSERVPNYHRLDLRATRDWELSFGRLKLYVDIQNVYDQDNLAGFDLEIDEEVGEILLEREYWAGFLPSAGAILEF